MKTALTIVGLGIAAFAFYRMIKAKRAGMSPLAAIRHPTLSVALADLAAHPERQQTRSGAGHFGTSS
jgi:hypothetical protein